MTPTTPAHTGEHPAAGMPARDPAMFYGLAGQIAQDAAAGRHTEADPVGIFVSLLAGLGALIGPRPHVQVGPITHPVGLLWPLLFGTTGTGRKGEATGTAERYLKASTSSELPRIAVSGLSSGEGLIERIRDEEEVKHGKEVDFIGTADKRLFVVETEFGGVMVRGRREGSTLSSTLRQAWDGHALSVLNRQALRASSSHVVIVGHVTPKEFRVRASELDMAGGTFNRFFPIWVDRSVTLPLPTPISPASLDAFGDRLHRAAQRAAQIGEITLDRESEAYWRDHLYDELNGDGGDDLAWSEFTRRIQPYARRISGLHAALDGRARVTRPDLEAAAALCRYSLASAKYVLGDSRREPRVDRILRAVHEAPDGITRNEVRDMFSRNLKSDLLDVLLAEVAQDHDVTEITDRKTGGRPATVYQSTRNAEARDNAETPG